MIASLGGSAAKDYYYEKDPIFNDQGKGENLTWGGKGAEKLGLSGNIDKKDFGDLLDGKHKGEELRNKDQQRSGKERKAYDIVLSAPKSVSHAALVFGNKDVIAAHDNAVKTAMNKAEESASTRVTSEGKRRREPTGNLIYAQAKHSISRAT